MKTGTEVKKNFLRFFLDPMLLSKKEAEVALEEEGVNINQLERNEERFIKKLEAKLALKKGSIKKERFKGLLDEFKKIKNDIIVDDDYAPQFSYKNKILEGLEDEEGSVDSAKLLKFLEEKTKERKN